MVGLGVPGGRVFQSFKSWNLEDFKSFRNGRIHQNVAKSQWFAALPITVLYVNQIIYNVPQGTLANSVKSCHPAPHSAPAFCRVYFIRKVVWKAQHFPKEHMKCTETQCVFHSFHMFAYHHFEIHTLSPHNLGSGKLP